MEENAGGVFLLWAGAGGGVIALGIEAACDVGVGWPLDAQALARVGKATVWADAHDTARSRQLALRRERLREPSSAQRDR